MFGIIKKIFGPKNLDRTVNLSGVRFNIDQFLRIEDRRLRCGLITQYELDRIRERVEALPEKVSQGVPLTLADVYR